MTHTSGLGELNNRQPHLTLAETSQLLAKQPLRGQPGERWGYSTAGIDILGRVVEVVSGMPFDRFLQTRVLDPLGMKNTSFWVPADQTQRFAHPYVLNADTHKLEETRITYLYNTDITDRQRPPLGGAGLFSTAEDIGRFYQMTINHGSWNGKQILKPETLAEMTRNQIGTLTARPGMPWGYGFCVIEDPSKMEANTMMAPGSFGHGGAFGTNSWVDIKKGVVYVLMLERDRMGNPDNSPMHQLFQQAAAEALEK
jgi:CubicO group peptidase (beta-lactamase class C family)